LLGIDLHSMIVKELDRIDTYGMNGSESEKNCIIRKDPCKKGFEYTQVIGYNKTRPYEWRREGNDATIRKDLVKKMTPLRQQTGWL
jgi:hypothetical protein